MTKLRKTKQVTLNIWLKCTVLKWFDKNYTETRKECIAKVIEFDYLSDLDNIIANLKKDIKNNKDLIKPDAINKIVTDIRIDSIELADNDLTEDEKSYLFKLFD